MARGGARPGAGRKAKADKHETAIGRAEARCRDRLPDVIGNLERIADGDTPHVEEKWAAAGTVTVEVQAVDGDGKPLFDPRGRPLMVDVPAFPGRGPEELVLVERKVATPGPDFRANEYLANRVMGKPTERKEVSGPDGGAIPVSIEHAIAKIYGEPLPGPEAGP